MHRLLALILAFCSTASLAADALPIMVTTKAGQPNPGFLTGAEADGLIISTSPVGGNSVKMPYSNIQELNVEEPKGWSSALLQLNAGNFAEAEKAFAALADDYANLVPWKDGYGSLARLNHFKALKNLGKFQELATVMDRQLAKPLVLGDATTIEFNDLRGWAILGKGDILALQSYINEFQDSTPSKWSLQSAFKPGLPARIVASLAYLRGHLHEKQQRAEFAIMDYHTAMTYNNGTDRSLFGLASLAALRVTAAQLAAKPEDATVKRTAYSLATVYRDSVGQGKLPKEFEAFLAFAPAPEPSAAAK
jgi:tetratricopeptide (TPR) repeat protein